MRAILLVTLALATLVTLVQGSYELDAALDSHAIDLFCEGQLHLKFNDGTDQIIE